MGLDSERERESGRRRLQSNKVEKDTYYFLRGNGNKTSRRQRPSYPSLKHLKLARLSFCCFIF